MTFWNLPVCLGDKGQPLGDPRWPMGDSGWLMGDLWMTKVTDWLVDWLPNLITDTKSGAVDLWSCLRYWLKTGDQVLLYTVHIDKYQSHKALNILYIDG